MVRVSQSESQLPGVLTDTRALGARAAVPEVEIDYPLALARAITATRAPGQKPFRYVYCSGVAAERDQSKSLWFAQSVRHIKVGRRLTPSNG
jgi:hypothetical protein